MNRKKFLRYREKFDAYLQKASASKRPEQKISLYNKLLKIIKKLQFLEIKGKVSVKPPLMLLEKFFLKSREHISGQKAQADDSSASTSFFNES